MHTEYRNRVYMSPFSDLILHISISFYTIQDHFRGLDTFHLYVFLSIIFLTEILIFISMYYSLK